MLTKNSKLITVSGSVSLCVFCFVAVCFCVCFLTVHSRRCIRSVRDLSATKIGKQVNEFLRTHKGILSPEVRDECRAAVTHWRTIVASTTGAVV